MFFPPFLSALIEEASLCVDILLYACTEERRGTHGLPVQYFVCTFDNYFDCKPGRHSQNSSEDKDQEHMEADELQSRFPF